MKLFLASFLLFISSFLWSQKFVSTADQQAIREIVLNYERNQKLFSERYPIHLVEGTPCLSMIGCLNSPSAWNPSKYKNVQFSRPIGAVVHVKIPINQLHIVPEFTEFKSLHIAAKVQQDLDRVVKDTRADSVHRGIDLPQSYTGADVLIGITDWGFDYGSPMFYDTLLQQTRILAAWDQFKTSGPHPNGYNYGTEYNSASELIAAQSDTSNVYKYGTHGTHVAGIAAGSGAGTVYRGLAPSANLLLVTFLVDEGAVLDAWQWLYDKSIEHQKRLVVNMSWGLYYIGSLDGNSPISQAITHFTDLGVTFVNSAGNNGNVNFHLKKNFANDELKTRIEFYTYTFPTMWGQSIHAWGENGKPFESAIYVANSSGLSMIESPYYGTSYTNQYVDSFLVYGLDTVYYNVSCDAAHPFNGRPQIRFRVKSKNSSIRVMYKSRAAEGTVHYWNVTELTSGVGNWGMSFMVNGSGSVSGDALYGLSEPSVSDDVISVAAYAPQYQTGGGSWVGGAIASFSSIGPRYDGAAKPDIAAPGVSIASSMSSYYDQSFSSVANVPFNGRTYHFAKLSGTSMASPAVAGIAALILEANPYLTPRQVKSVIKETARTDSFTGVIWGLGSTTWGMGKINAYKAVQVAVELLGTVELTTENFLVYPNPTSDKIQISLENQLDKVEVYNLNGQRLSVLVNDKTVDVSQLSPGTYWIRVVQNGKVKQAKFNKL